MKKITKKVSTIILFLCTSFISINELKAQNNSSKQSDIQQFEFGTIISLNSGLNFTSSLTQNAGLTKGLIQNDITGELYEFHYAGPEIFEINEKYIYTLQITASGKIIIRDIRHSN